MRYIAVKGKTAGRSSWPSYHAQPHTLCASAFSAAATLMRLAALISFMASLTFLAGSMSVTSA